MLNFDEAWDSRVRGVNFSSECQTMLTPDGPVYLRNHCPPALLEQLRPDRGLHAFARLPEREYELLLRIAGRGDSSLALAYTPSGVIVGQVTLAPVDGWWEELLDAREIAFEVSAGWRRLGIARRMLALTMDEETLEQLILLGMGFSWHWETEELGLTPLLYRDMLARLAASQGFVEYLTSEPNIRSHPANILLARLGRQVRLETLSQFYACLLKSETLPGL